MTVPRRLRWDVLLAVLLCGATFVVHDVGYLLRLPFWTDEAWVAISTRLPLHELLRVTASTPVGWSLLLRLVFFGGEQGLRLLPLAFAALTVGAAYVFARSLPWGSVPMARLAAVLAGLAALLVPSALARDDLKQYTADAFVTIVVLHVVSQAEGEPFRRRLAGLGLQVVVAFFFSAVAAFAGAAAFAGLLAVAAGRAQWRRVAEIAVVGGGTGVLLAVIFLLVYRPGVPPGLHAYWQGSYVPLDRGWAASWIFLSNGFRALAGYLGLGPVAVAVVLVAGGVATAVVLGRTAVGLTVPVLLVEMVLLGAAGQYPLFDLRTSHFLTTALAVTGALGVAGACALLGRWHPAAAVVAATLFVLNVRDGIRAEVINQPSSSVEDLRTPTAYVAGHLAPGDLVLVTMHSSWGFAYYWPTGTPAIQPVTSNLQRFITVFPDQPNIVVATDRTRQAVDEAVERVAAAADRRSPTARIWFIHQHYSIDESHYYAAAFAAHQLRVTTVTSGALDRLNIATN